MTSSRWPRLAWPAAALAVPLAVLAFHASAAAPGQAFVGEDLRYFFFAVREATAAALRAGHLPGWQRGIFLGYPLLADPQAAVLDWATWLTLPWREAPRALTVATLLHLVLGGLGMLAWLRARGLGAAEALLGALLFTLGAKQTVHLQHWNFAASLAWWPWMLCGVDAFAARGRGRSLALTAFAAAGSWLGGAAQMAYFGTLVAGAHALALAPTLWRRRRADAVLALLAAPLGLLLAGAVVLPVIELARLGPRGAGVAYAFATSWKWPDRWGLALLLLPRAFGGGWYLQEMNLWEATGYLGLLPLALAAAAPLRRRGLVHWLALAVVGVWLCFGEGAWLGLHRGLYRFLPGYGSFRNPTRSLFVTLFAVCLLAAEGLAALRARPFRERAAAWRAALVLAALALLAPVLARFPSFSLDREAAARTAPAAVLLALGGLAWLGAGAWLRREPRRAAGWAAAAAALVYADLHLAFSGWNKVAPAAAERPPLADAAPHLASAPAPRRLAVLAAWGATANAPLRLGYEGVTGYGPTVVQRVRSLLEATETDELVPPLPVAGDTNFPRPDPTSALWPLLAAPLVASDEPLDLPEVARLRPEFSAPTMLYRAPALPRVFWTGAWERVEDAAAAEPLLAAARGDRALLAPDAPALGVTPGVPEGPVPAAAVRADGGIVEAELTAPRAGLAVVLEPWFPGWTATVDGAPAPLARADYAFIAVPVPAGAHRLRLEYRPAQLGRGVALSLGTAALLAAALAWRRRSARSVMGRVNR